MNRGILFAASAYLLWGVFPIYWKALKAVPSVQILSHRIVWSVAFLLVVVVIRRGWESIKQALSSRSIMAASFLAALLLGVNWLTYIWGVNAGFVVETSLGYFINPLVSVLIGVIFLRERLRPLQWFPVALAGIGVLYLTISYGSLPWIALTLALSFGFYGLVKKTTPLGSVSGLTLETGILFIPALAYLGFEAWQGTGAFGELGWSTDFLLVGSGVVTALPLLLFASAAHRINLTTLGILQYIAPTGQLLLGVFLYGEPFTIERFIGFGLIWLALLIYTLEGFQAHRRASSRAALSLGK